jgi:hypothetical protein
VAAIDLGCDARHTDFGFGDNGVRLFVAIIFSSLLLQLNF